MIESIVTRWVAANSISEVPATWTLTVYVVAGPGHIGSGPMVTAQIDLSRVRGGGSAKAYISQYETKGFFDTEPLTHGVEPPLSFSDPAWIHKGESSVTFNEAYSVTFGLTAINMYAYADCSVFIYQ